jgi:hypothetical protein
MHPNKNKRDNQVQEKDNGYTPAPMTGITIGELIDPIRPKIQRKLEEQSNESGREGTNIRDILLQREAQRTD